MPVTLFLPFFLFLLFHSLAHNLTHLNPSTFIHITEKKTLIIACEIIFAFLFLYTHFAHLMHINLLLVDK